MPDTSLATKDWIKRRADAVRARYKAFECLHENGHGGMLVDEDTPVQVFCPFHGNVNTAAARYYPASGNRSDYVHCFRCKESWDCVSLYMRFKGLPFMDALKDLERRFRISVPKHPEGPPIEEPRDKGSSEYVSDAWQDVPRVLVILEKKLARLRDVAPMCDYVKFCRVLDHVQWDLDLAHGKQSEVMVSALGKLRAAMDEAEARGNAPC